MIDLRVLRLRGCNVVFGVDWMRMISPISFDFNKLEVTITKDGKTMTLIGSTYTSSCKMITRKQLERLFKLKLDKAK